MWQQWQGTSSQQKNVISLSVLSGGSATWTIRNPDTPVCSSSFSVWLRLSFAVRSRGWRGASVSLRSSLCKDSPNKLKTPIPRWSMSGWIAGSVVSLKGECVNSYFFRTFTTGAAWKETKSQPLRSHHLVVINLNDSKHFYRTLKWL